MRQAPSSASSSCSAATRGANARARAGRGRREWGRAGAWLPFGPWPWDDSTRVGEKRSRSMTIALILERKGSEVLSIPADATVREAVAMLAERRIGAVPVTEDGRVAGIMSERDVIYCLKSDGAAILDWPVSKVMT